MLGYYNNIIMLQVFVSVFGFCFCIKEDVPVCDECICDYSGMQICSPYSGQRSESPTLVNAWCYKAVLLIVL